MKKKILTIFLISFLISCKTSDNTKTVVIEDRYSLTIPSFLTKVNNLNEDASLQYQHAWKEFYVIVIDELKTDFQVALDQNNLTETHSNDINSYSNLLLDNFEQVISVSNKSTIVDTTINNFPAKLLTINGRVEGIDAFYSLAFIESKKRYYQIMAWTLSSKKYEYDEKMRELIYTFREL